MLIELRTATLPWKGKNRTESEKIKEKVPDAELFKVGLCRNNGLVKRPVLGLSAIVPPNQLDPEEAHLQGRP